MECCIDIAEVKFRIPVQVKIFRPILLLLTLDARGFSLPERRNIFPLLFRCSEREKRLAARVAAARNAMIVFIFSWDLQWSQGKIKTMFMQNFGGQTKSIMVFLKVALRIKYKSLYYHDIKYCVGKFCPIVNLKAIAGHIKARNIT